MTSTAYGFRVVGPPTESRRLVDWQRAFYGQCLCAPQAEPNSESYLSLFTFGDDFAKHLQATGSTRGYHGPAALPYLAFDLDNADLDAALADARGLAASLLQRYTHLDDDQLLIFFSGSKGFHVCLPMPVGIGPTPSTPADARNFATLWAAHANAKIDAGIYDASRLFRSPNSRHPKTGLHKRRLTYRELLGLSADRIRDLARGPLPFDPPTAPDHPYLLDDWQKAAKAAALERTAKAERFAANGSPTLPKRTLAMIRGEWLPDAGDRHRLLFSASASLGETGCPLPLALALLTEPGLNAGLSPADVKRQIECGLSHGKGATGRASETGKQTNAKDR